MIKGKAKLTVVDRETRETAELAIGEDNMVTVEIPPGKLHWITNTGEEDMYLLGYTDEAFDSKDPDTYYETVSQD